ncbi:GT4 family glycosyltransferase PelF [Geodermatophilus sp. SYSU D00700]
MALVTEGSYPVKTGGVSTWCDQLIKGMSRHEWTVISLTATGGERSVWPQPPALRRVVLHPMWGTLPSGVRRLRRSADLHRAVQLALARLWDAALAPDGEEAVAQARAALRSLVRLSDGQRLAALLATRGSAGALLTAWGARCAGLPPLSVADAVAAANIVDRTLAVVDAAPTDVDLVHSAGNGGAGMIGLAAYWRHGIPMVLSEHGVYLRERYLALNDGSRSWAERRAVTALVRRICEVAYREADLVLPVSDFNRRWAQRLGADPGRVVTILNGVEPELYEPVGAEPEVPTLSFVGRIDPLKDLHTLVRAFAIVRRQLPEARLRLFGPVPEGNEAYRDSVAELIQELGLTDSATFEGPTKGSRPAIAAGSIVVLSSISEGLPFTVIEAMMCGRATVSTDVGGVAECLDEDRRAGVVVPSRDPEAFAAASLDLLRDDERRRAMSFAAREHALATATLDRALAAYQSAYQQTATRRLTAPPVPVPVAPVRIVPVPSVPLPATVVPVARPPMAHPPVPRPPVAPVPVELPDDMPVLVPTPRRSPQVAGSR